MTTWRLDPVIEEDVGQGYRLNVSRASRGRSGKLILSVELWNDKPKLLRDVSAGDRADEDVWVAEVLRIEPNLDPHVIRTKLVAMAVDASDREPRKGDGDGTDTSREQLSLTPPGFVCVALDEDGQRVYVVCGDDGAIDALPHIDGPYKSGEIVRHVPPPDLPWRLPRVTAIQEHWQEARCQEGWTVRLLDDLIAWHKAASDLGREEAYLLLALYDMLTYVQEHTDYLPIIVLEAEPERGKSRTGQAAIFVCRHGMHLVGIREANLLRDAGDRQATLFIDLMDVWATLVKKDCTDIILGRWERGGTVERVVYPERGAFGDTIAYEVYGPTIIATNEPIHRILDTRCLRIDMPLTKRRFAGRVRAEDALLLVERLMAWRAVMLAGTLGACDAPADGRQGDILRPLRQVLLAVAPERGAQFDSIVAWQTGRRRDELAQSWEADVIQAVAANVEHVSNGYLALERVLDTFNRDRGEKDQRTAKWMGAKVGGLGWTKERIGRDKKTSLQWDDDLLDRLQRRYGLVDERQDTSPEPASVDVPHVPHVPHDGRNGPHMLANVPRPTPDMPHDVPRTTQAYHGQRELDAVCAAHAAHASEGTDDLDGDSVDDWLASQESLQPIHPATDVTPPLAPCRGCGAVQWGRSSSASGDWWRCHNCTSARVA